MREILHAAGIDEARLKLIKPIIDTCRECRAWAQRGNVTQASFRIVLKFNEECETDIMFYKKSLCWHIIDKAIRLSDGCIINDKEKETLFEAYSTVWTQRQGPPIRLVTDGEGGWNNAWSKKVKFLRLLGPKWAQPLGNLWGVPGCAKQGMNEATEHWGQTCILFMHVWLKCYILHCLKIVHVHTLTG